MSTTGNLTLDSLEYSQGRVSPTTAYALLSAFSTQVLDDNPSIKFITLGKGGGTFRDLGFKTAAIPELISSGYKYGDAENQYCIQSTKHCIISDAEYTQFISTLSKPSEKLLQCINYLRYYLTEKFERVDAVKLG